MQEYNFDPMTGEPIPKPEPVTPPEEVSPPAEPTIAEEPIPAAEPVVPKEPAPAYAQEEVTSFYSQPYEPQPPKEPKTLTMKHLIGGIAIAVVLSLVSGFAGAILANRLGREDGLTMNEGSVVIYKTTKLEGSDSALSVEQVAALVKPSVVAITTEQVVTGSFMQQYISEGAGSGVIITADGYIVTNHHVIDGATNIKVTLDNTKSYSAKLIGTDAKADLAVIKIEETGLTPAPYGNAEELKLAETVVAVGNPLGELEGTVTSGVLSALDREIAIENTTMRLLQTDTAINPGNSGGGLFNTSGQLIGVVNAKSAGEEIEGLGFAIPIDTVETVVEDLINHGYVTGRVDPGFTFVEINDSMTAMMYRVNRLGLYISGVAENSDGAKAGFRSGDYVISIDGTEVSTTAEAYGVIDGKGVGDTLTFEIERGNEKMTLTLTLSEYVPSLTNQANKNPLPLF